MPKIKNVSGEDRIVPGLGGRLVLAGQVVDLPEDEVWSYTCQTDNWQPADDATQDIHDAAEQVADEYKSPTEPPGNAARDVWVAYVLAAGLATEDDLTELTRDQIRDTYKSQEG